ncbi:MAG: DUF262 domain-containing protein [Deltaproteobacteria bacterium]|nr:DUF262 domain-containing protein [Deltaproteobacteria bacterium]
MTELLNDSLDNKNDEAIEGLDTQQDENGWDYPIDTLLIRTEVRTVFDVIRRIRDKVYILDPDFQRDFIWDKKTQSKLIESVLMRIPLPVFYLAEDDQGHIIVVDGLQRLSTFRYFLDNNLQLNLNDNKDLNGKYFKDLPPKLKNRIEDCNLTIYLIDSKVPERARLDIFDRVNSGKPLTRQQMRNSLYNGKATRFLKEEANTELFKKATGGSLNTQKMNDREFVNRFCSFYLLDLEQYKNGMDDWLALGLKKMNKLDDSELVNLSQKFRQTLENNLLLFNEQAFRKHKPDQKNRGIINASLWDVMTVGLADYASEQVKDNSVKIKEGFYALLDDKDFIESITYGPSSTKCVRHRFNVIQELMKGVLGDHTS